ncbi:MAG: endonuclease domain-containing protein [Chloroflexia bacterium]|nr:endonuclease domain-containing protein [Chloroflexia bacterium]
MDSRQQRGPHGRRETSRQLIEAARRLRQTETSAEQLLWEQLRNRRLAGMKFRRQHPFGPFVLDFCCPDNRLVVELDGAIHDEQTEQDTFRTRYISSFGYRVLRFHNYEVFVDLPSVLDRILNTAEILPDLALEDE